MLDVRFGFEAVQGQGLWFILQRYSNSDTSRL